MPVFPPHRSTKAADSLRNAQILAILVFGILLLGRGGRGMEDGGWRIETGTEAFAVWEGGTNVENKESEIRVTAILTIGRTDVYNDL